MQKLTKIFLGVLFFIISFIAGLAIAGFILEDKIIALSLEQVNKQLNVKLSVQSVEVSLIKGFPKASVSMKRVTIVEGSLDNPPELEPGLLSVENVTLKMSLIGIFSNNYAIDELILSNGWLNLYFDNSGKGNFEIFKKTDSEPNNWLLDLNEFKLTNINLSYIDLKTGWVAKGYVDNASLKGVASKEKLEVELESKLVVGSLKQGDFYYLRNQKVELNTHILISSSEIDILPTEAKIGKTNVNVRGLIGRDEGAPVFLQVNGKNLGVETLLNLTSQHNIALPTKARTKGQIGFNLDLSGFAKTENPFLVKLDFFSKNLVFQIPEKPELIVDDIKGTFTNGNKGTAETSELVLSSIKVISGSSWVNGTVKVKNISTPLYHVKVDHKLNMADLLVWGIESPIESGLVSGNFEALGLLPRLDNLTIYDFENSKFYTDVDLSNLYFRPGGTLPSFERLSGNIKIVNQNITSSKIRGVLNKSDFNAEIQVQNATGIVFGNRKATINANITLDTLNTLWVLEQNKPKADSSSPINIWDRINSISGDIFVDELIHKDFRSSPLSANFYLKDKHLFCNSFLSRSCSGLFTGKFSTVEKSESNYDLSANINFDGVNITELFASFNNFDQEYVKSSNVSGRLDGNLAFSSNINDGNVAYETIIAKSRVTIMDGRLSGIKQLESLSRFIELDDLRDISFLTLENNIRLENQMVIIPEMEVKSSAINLSVSGTHSFNGDYLYRFKLLLSDILFSKASRNKPENNRFGVVEENGNKKTNLYLKLEGNKDGSSVSYDRSTAREAFRENLRTERQSLKSILRDEFKFLRKNESDQHAENELDLDTLLSTPSKDDDKKIKQEEGKKPKFTIEWDDTQPE